LACVLWRDDITKLIGVKRDVGEQFDEDRHKTLKLPSIDGGGGAMKKKSGKNPADAGDALKLMLRIKKVIQVESEVCPCREGQCTKLSGCFRFRGTEISVGLQSFIETIQKRHLSKWEEPGRGFSGSIFLPFDLMASEEL
jgi:hypothetical protein